MGLRYQIFVFLSFPLSAATGCVRKGVKMLDMQSSDLVLHLMHTNEYFSFITPLSSHYDDVSPLISKAVCLYLTFFKMVDGDSLKVILNVHAFTFRHHQSV